MGLPKETIMRANERYEPDIAAAWICLLVVSGLLNTGPAGLRRIGIPNPITGLEAMKTYCIA